MHSKTDMKIKINKKVAYVGLTSIVAAIPIITSVSMTLKKDSSDTNTIKYYSQHEAELSNKLKDRYEELSKLSVTSNEYNNFVRWAKKQDSDTLFNKSRIVSKIANLNLSLDLKLFLLQNYIEKLQMTQIDKGDIQERTSQSSLSDFRHPSNLARYIFSGMTHVSTPSWDFGEDKGEIDPLTGIHFSKLLQNIDSNLKTEGSRTGWHDMNADHDFKAYRIKVMFMDKETGIIDWFYIYINTAQDTDGINEDYTFMALEPSSPSHYVYIDGKKVPTIFGVPLDINNMKLEAVAKGLHIDNPYVGSYHEEDYGEDNEGGNCLDDIPGVTSLYVREGSKSLMHVGRDVTNYVYQTLNSLVLGFDQINPNLLYTKNQFGFEYYNDVDGNRVPLKGQDHKDVHYDNSFHDVTDIFWSNQKVLDCNLSALWKYMNNNSLILQEIVFGGDSVLGASTTFQDILKTRLDKLSNISTRISVKAASLNFSKNFIVENLLQTITSLAKTNWHDKESIIQTFGNFGISLSSSLVGAAIPAFYSAVSTVGFAEAFGEAFMGAFLGPVGAIGSFALSTLLSIIPTNNGQSAASNLMDHGMNDWNYQLRNHYENLVNIASNWSESYKHGVHWTIKDDWNHMPKLFIATQNDNPNSGDILNTEREVHGFNNGGSLPVITK